MTSVSPAGARPGPVPSAPDTNRMPTTTVSGPTTTVSGPTSGPAERFTGLLPAPVSLRPEPGVLHTLTPETVIWTSGQPEAVAVGTGLATLLRRCTGYALPVVGPDGAVAAGAIRLLLVEAGQPVGPAPQAGLAAEGYRLDVDSGSVLIQASTGAGLFYGTQTLRQLLPPEVESATPRPGPWQIAGGQISDHPRFAYRGAMLDVCRHFFGVADLERYIDELALYKINHLHLHLTDDQGWRIAINSRPRLATIGGATQIGGGPGGYYTQEQYRHIVAYAAARYVTIVPEIDMPGHTNAALVAYPELSRDGVAPEPYTGRDVGFSALRADHEPTYDLIRDVLHEVAALTPGPWLHIGGDEAFRLSPEDYATFLARVQPMVAATGKTVIGWHQIAPTAHSPGRVIQYWHVNRADLPVSEAVRQGARVLLSPGNHTYLDMRYDADTPIGHDWAGHLELHQVYDWDPGDYLADVPFEAVLGVEAPLWTETVTSMAEIEFMTFPRLAAIAELGWSPTARRDWAGFRDRVAAQGPRWDVAGIHYHRSPQVPWPTAGGPTVPAPRAGVHDQDPAHPG